MGRVQKLSARAQCYEIIKEKILRQEYDFGAELNIATLSAELSVSNTPVREALSQLEADGLIVTNVNLKAQVVQITPEMFQHTVSAIYILIRGAYELCVIEKRIPALLEQMEESFRRQEILLATEDFFAFTKELVNFDKIMFDVLGNPQLSFLFERISSILFLMYRTNMQKRADWESIRSVEEHRKIIDAIASDDDEAVKKLIKEHLHQSYFE